MEGDGAWWIVRGMLCSMTWRVGGALRLQFLHAPAPARLAPRFLRFPGGCYVEGDWLRGAFRWKDTLGRNKERPGHHNSM